MKLAATARVKRVAALLFVTLALFSVAACGSSEPQVIEREVIVREVQVVVTATPAAQAVEREVVVKEVQVVVTATPVAQAANTSAPTHTAVATLPPIATSAPQPANTPMPTHTAVATVPATATPVPQPTNTPAPTATPTPTLTIEDYYVIINQGGLSGDGQGIVSIYDNAEDIESGVGYEILFPNEDFFVNYLASEGVITTAQIDAYYTPVSSERENYYYNGRWSEFFDEDYAGNIKIPLKSFANAVHKKTLGGKIGLYVKGKEIIERGTIEGDLARIIRYVDPGTVAKAIPTLTIDDYYVIINQGLKPGDGSGIMAWYDQARHIESGNGREFSFYNEDNFLNYMVSIGIITPAQRNAYYTPVSAERLNDYRYDRAAFLDEDYVGNIKIPLRTFANAIYKAVANGFHDGGAFSLHGEEILTRRRTEVIINRFADKDAVDSGMATQIPSGGGNSSGEGGHVVIRDGGISVSGTSVDGVTTSVMVDTVDTGELLDYLLSQNKITVAQRDEYGRTGELELSLADMPDFFDWAISSDEGIRVGIDEEGVDFIRDRVLPLFGD